MIRSIAEAAGKTPKASATVILVLEACAARSSLGEVLAPRGYLKRIGPPAPYTALEHAWKMTAENYDPRLGTPDVRPGPPCV